MPETLVLYFKRMDFDCTENEIKDEIRRIDPIREDAKRLIGRLFYLWKLGEFYVQVRPEDKDKVIELLTQVKAIQYAPRE